MATIPFDLTQNPFHILGLSIRAGCGEVDAAREEAFIRGRASKEILDELHRTVRSHIPRMDAELSWLPSVSPTEATELVSSLQEGNLASADELLASLPGLDRANLAADLCVRTAGTTRYINTLLDAYGDFSVASALATLRDLRRISGFPDSDRREVRASLSRLRVNHARAAMACVVAAKDPGETLTEIVRVFARGKNANASSLLDAIVEEYVAWSQPQLDKVQHAIEALIDRRGRDDIEESATRMFDLLGDWKSVNRPVQVLEGSKGRDEPRSRMMCEIVRGQYVWLVHEIGSHSYALDLSRTLLDTICELPEIAGEVAEDVECLESVPPRTQHLGCMFGLFELARKIRIRRAEFSNDKLCSDIEAGSQPDFKTYMVLFSEAASLTSHTFFVDLMWRSVRKFLVELCGEFRSPVSTHSLLERLMSVEMIPPSKKVQDLLDADLYALRRFVKWESLKTASRSEAMAIVNDLLDNPRPGELEHLKKIRAILLWGRKDVAEDDDEIWPNGHLGRYRFEC